MKRNGLLMILLLFGAAAALGAFSKEEDKDAGSDNSGSDSGSSGAGASDTAPGGSASGAAAGASSGIVKPKEDSSGQVLLQPPTETRPADSTSHILPTVLP